MALSGDLALIGAASSDFARGQVYMFTRSGTTWTEQSILKPSDLELGDAFGASVAVSGGTALVGSPNTGTGDTGAAYVFVAASGGIPNRPAEVLVAVPRQTVVAGTGVPPRAPFFVATSSLGRPVRNALSFQISVSTASGQTYWLEYKDSLTDSDWKPITSVQGDGAERELVDPNARGASRFYRVRVAAEPSGAELNR